jgi:uncharacterized protein
MSVFAVLFEDDPELADAVRQRHMADHLTFLETHAKSIRAAGPLRETQDRTPAGGLWVVEAANPDAVELLVRSDPFWPTGLRRSFRILTWSQVFADGKRRI